MLYSKLNIFKIFSGCVHSRSSGRCRCEPVRPILHIFRDSNGHGGLQGQSSPSVYTFGHAQNGIGSFSM